MKVPGGENSEKLRIQSLQKPSADNSEAVQIHKSADKAKQAQAALGDSTDKVSLSLGRLLSQELNPGQADTARNERVAELKRLIELGQYKPEPEKVAKTLADYLDEEISIENLLAIGKDQTETEE